MKIDFNKEAEILMKTQPEMMEMKNTIVKIKGSAEKLTEWII